MVEVYTVVVGVVRHSGKYLIGRRSEGKRFAPGQWEFISGFVEPNESPHKTILRELLEETGLKGRITGSGRPYTTIDEEGKWISMPFLIEVESAVVKVNRADHSDLRWVNKIELSQYGDEHFQDDVKELISIGIIS